MHGTLDGVKDGGLSVNWPLLTIPGFTGLQSQITRYGTARNGGKWDKTAIIHHFSVPVHQTVGYSAGFATGLARNGPLSQKYGCPRLTDYGQFYVKSGQLYGGNMAGHGWWTGGWSMVPRGYPSVHARYPYIWGTPVICRTRPLPR